MSSKLGIWRSYLERLSGHITLVQGNHDSDKTVKALVEKFLLKDATNPLEGIKLRHDGMRFILFHYPMESWVAKNKDGSPGFHLHGHSHGESRTVRAYRMDVGVDAHGYRPISIDDVVAQLR
jgi:calcineurin-like phosphoesterase family protein